ncbi:MAG TPA: hypothetical protein VI895_10345 [Bdellovibrionota bacterium]|nr:hypothetical protein [Bdellovibrionota bacterium]
MKRTRAEIEEFWAEEITKWEASGKSALAYCRELNLKYSTFGYWRRQLRPVETGKAMAKASHFVPIPVISNPVPPELFFRVGGYEVLIRSSS